MEILFLGTSSLEALPRKGCNCPQCKSKNPKDRRTRSSILINKEILVDAGPDVVEQFSIFPRPPAGAASGAGNFHLASPFSNLKAVVITHKHEDHIKGLKKLKSQVSNLKTYYPKDGERMKVGGIEFFAFEVPHSKVVKTHGLFINQKIAYLPDFSKITKKTHKILKKSEIAILDGSMLNRPFGGHMPITQIISNLKSQNSNLTVYFTHNGHTHLPHKELEKFIQKQGGANFHLAFDGLELRVT